MTDQADMRRQQASAAGRPQGATAYAVQVVRRVLLRGGICVGAEDAELLADAVLASGGQVVRRVLGQGFCAEAKDAGLVADAIMAAYTAGSEAAGPPEVTR
jgi:hypothetical protein